MVTIALPNSVSWFVAVAATWKLGAIPQPVSSQLPERELEAIVDLADARVILGADPGTFGTRPCLPVGHRADPSISDARLPDAVSAAWKAPTSGGSTGRPKVIVSGDAATLDPAAPSLLGFRPDGCLVMPGPLYHNGPLVWACGALLSGSHVVVLPRFEAETTLAAIEAHFADVVYLVPTMMKRIWRLPTEVRLGYDLSSLRVVWHLAEPCPPWLKEAWIDWLGPERIVELGQVVHAIVEPESDHVDIPQLLAFLGERLVRYKVPRTVELVHEPLRNDAGKVRRSALRAERLEADPRAQAS